MGQKSVNGMGIWQAGMPGKKKVWVTEPKNPTTTTAGPAIDNKLCLYLAHKAGCKPSFKEVPHDFWLNRFHRMRNIREISFSHLARLFSMLVLPNEAEPRSQQEHVGGAGSCCCQFVPDQCGNMGMDAIHHCARIFGKLNLSLGRSRTGYPSVIAYCITWFYHSDLPEDSTEHKTLQIIEKFSCPRSIGPAILDG